jgi:hypothetical protein
MAREGKSYVWRKERCEGCERRCRYRDFKVFDRNGYRETFQMLMDNHDDPKLWRYKRRGTVLGIMHATKRERWELETRACREAQAGN